VSAKQRSDVNCASPPHEKVRGATSDTSASEFRVAAPLPNIALRGTTTATGAFT